MFRDIDYLNQHARRHITKNSRVAKILGEMYDVVENNNGIIDMDIYNKFIEVGKICDKSYSSKTDIKHLICYYIRYFNWKIVYEVALQIGMLKDLRMYQDVIIKKEVKQKSNCGVYGIFIGNRCIYVGYTERNFEQRWKEHINNIRQGSNELYLYEWLRNHGNPEISFKILINKANLLVSQQLDRHDMECMELGLIEYLNPICNVAGSSIPYEFTKQKKNFNSKK